MTKGDVYDSKKFCPLVKEAAQNQYFNTNCADKAHDDRRNFNLLEPTINIRKNISIKTKGCPLLRKVILISGLGLKRWKQLKDAERRWIAENCILLN